MHGAFSRCLKARLDWLHVRVLLKLPGCQEEAEHWKKIVMAEVFEIAENEAWSPEPRYGANTPPLFADVEELTSNYRKYFDLAVIERNLHAELEARLQAEFELKQDQEIIKAAEAERIGRLIQSGRWDELGLPSPQTLFEQLMSGDGQRVQDNFVDYDADDGVTYVDNPYSVTVGLCGIPDLETCLRFLTGVAHGKVIGPVPPGCEQ
ncbi:hypothetical protein [Pseudomonas sp. NPDC096950]|uniref:hypothetical protein n=1 Tax=Pseudomonas sp. NPDC096950 TaxID=3364485 RepID=UPI00383B855D